MGRAINFFAILGTNLRLGARQMVDAAKHPDDRVDAQSSIQTTIDRGGAAMPPGAGIDLNENDYV